MPSAEIRLLGSPRFEIAGQDQPLPEKAYVLVAILAWAGGRHVPRSQIRTILWADSDRDKANASLRQLVARIHRVEQTAGIALLSIDGEAVGLTPDCRVDYADFLSVLDAPAGSVAQGCAALADLWRGPLLEGISFGEAALDEWLDARREQMRQLFLEAGRRLLEVEPAPEHADAQWRLAGHILDIDQTEEAAYRSMMRICIARGERGFALRLFGRCKRILAAELGVQPDRRTLALAAELRDREASRAGNAAKRPAPMDARPGREVPVVMVLSPVAAGPGETFARLAASLAEDITVGLTRFRRFTVVTAPAPGVMTLAENCREAGLSVFDIDYTVSLSLMPAGQGYRLAVRLSDAGNAEVLWGTNPEFTSPTVGDTLDRLIQLMVGTLVEVIDTRQAQLAMTSDHATAYALCAQGQRLLRRADLQSIRRAMKLFKQAMAQVPDYPLALTGMARAVSEESLVRGISEPDLLQQAVDLARRARELDPSDGRAMRGIGRACLYLRRYDESLAAFEAAFALNPGDADILSDYADALAHCGEPKRGLPLSRRAMELNPVQPDDYIWTLGSIHFQLGEYQAALDAVRPMEGNPATGRLLSACAARIGDRDLARRYSRLVRETYPRFEVESVRALVPNRNRADTDHLIDGLRLAGLT
ncbi:MAG TPA: BTAD domain-containing putative transcriptional regulator [Dongiaceae bacterium]|nr:BTAD domain-containing putative transcriptional regulator [Dongiaceae bacterium]